MQSGPRRPSDYPFLFRPSEKLPDRPDALSANIKGVIIDIKTYVLLDNAVLKLLRMLPDIGLEVQSGSQRRIEDFP